LTSEQERAFDSCFRYWSISGELTFSVYDTRLLEPHQLHVSPGEQ
jgi:hypothetical protein